jgi:hypothetical protein
MKPPTATRCCRVFDPTPKTNSCRRSGRNAFGVSVPPGRRARKPCLAPRCEPSPSRSRRRRRKATRCGVDIRHNDRPRLQWDRLKFRHVENHNSSAQFWSLSFLPTWKFGPDRMVDHTTPPQLTRSPAVRRTSPTPTLSGRQPGFPRKSQELLGDLLVHDVASEPRGSPPGRRRGSQVRKRLAGGGTGIRAFGPSRKDRSFRQNANISTR